MRLAGGPTQPEPRQLEYERWVWAERIAKATPPSLVWEYAEEHCSALGVSPRAMLGGHKPSTKAARGEVFVRLWKAGFTLAQIEDGMRWGKMLLSRGG